MKRRVLPLLIGSLLLPGSGAVRAPRCPLTPRLNRRGSHGWCRQLLVGAGGGLGAAAVGLEPGDER